MTHEITTPSEGSGRARACVLLVEYQAELAAVDAAMPAHRRFLDQHFASGEFLVSGPRDPRTGGVIIARGTSDERLQEMIAADPFVRQGLATYEVVAFLPTRGDVGLSEAEPTTNPELRNA